MDSFNFETPATNADHLRQAVKHIRVAQNEPLMQALVKVMQLQPTADHKDRALRMQLKAELFSVRHLVDNLLNHPNLDV